MRVTDVVRLDFGTFVRPGEESGTGTSRVEAVLGYVARTAHGLLLLDTGLGEAGPEVEAWYAVRYGMDDALERNRHWLEGRTCACTTSGISASGLIAAGCDVVTVQRGARALVGDDHAEHLQPSVADREDRTRAAAAGLINDAFRLSLNK